MTIDFGSSKTLQNLAIANEGRINWVADDDVQVAGGSLRNDGSVYLLGDGSLTPWTVGTTTPAGFNVTNNGTLYRQESAGAVVWAVQDFLNPGTIQVDTGEFDINGWYFQNSGLVQVGDAKFRLAAGGTSSGQFLGTSDQSVFEFAASQTLTAASSVNVGGAVVFSGASNTAVLGSYSPWPSAVPGKVPPGSWPSQPVTSALPSSPPYAPACPAAQEEILFLPPTVRGHDPIPLTRLHAIAQILDWPRQRTHCGQPFGSVLAAFALVDPDLAGVQVHVGHKDVAKLADPCSRPGATRGSRPGVFSRS